MLGMMDMFNNASGDNSFNNVNSSGFNNASSNEFNNNNSNDNSEFSNFNNNTGSGGFNNININNILNSSQKDMYNEYIKQLLSYIFIFVIIILNQKWRFICQKMIFANNCF